MDFSHGESPFHGWDEAAYLALVEWTGRAIREDKPGHIPREVAGVMDRFGLDARLWARNVESYGTLFHRIAGRAERLRRLARERGQRWFRGLRGGRLLYAKRGTA